ncbi:UNVERIFIED_CONTAM: Myosin type-2 heavy chain 1, partial [Siphonaria sp. JEL0065]
MPVANPGEHKAFDIGKALLDYKKDTRAYFEDASEGWIAGQVTEDAQEKDGFLIIGFTLDAGSNVTFKKSLSALSNADLPPLENPAFITRNLNDLSLLSHLHEPAVLSGIKNRFTEMQQIYTYSGMVLIAMNPFAKVPKDIYSPKVMKQYIGSKRHELEPHIFGIAEGCFQAMLRGKNQSVIVSGESGAGKTQSTKYIMQYLAVVDSLSKGNLENVVHSETEDAVLATNPILESFGNAKTTRNDNSSRFGKFVELFFSDPETGQIKITGAQIRTYLLERSRLIHQPMDERNYHIFYQLCAAAPAAERKQLGLETWQKFKYLNQGNAGVVRNVDDLEEFKATQVALSTLGMSVSTQWNIFRICAALLHLGNIDISQDPNKDEASCVADSVALIKASELLGIDQADFVKWLTHHKKKIGKETYEKDLKVDMALVSRDSVTKVIYTKLFDWLVRAINKNLKRDSTADQKIIGVLDIYGFEHFQVNSFEQFCINYTNEKLQQEFNAHVFRNEQQLYIHEGIQWTMIEFSDNQECIDLIEAKMGVLGLLDEATHLGSVTDAQFVSNMNANLVKSQSYQTDRFGKGFTIRHYAVPVTYAASGFIDKNKDSMSEELQAVLMGTKDSFLYELFCPVVEDSSLEETVYSSPTKKLDGRRGTLKTPTLGSMFKTSLQGLMATIRDTESHYIRCIKPNMAKSAFKYDGAMVLSQLKACGVLETIKISNAGYPNKLGYNEFAARYDILVKSCFWETLSERELTMKIVTSVVSDTSKYQFGHSKVFLKSGQMAFFEARRWDRIIELSKLVCKNFKRYTKMRQYQDLKQGVAVMQNACRGFLARKKLVELRAEAVAIKEAKELARKREEAAIILQTACRGYIARHEFAKKVALIVLVQNTVRCIAARRILKTLRADAKSVDVVKQKAFALESKVMSLSQSLNAKTVEAKELAEKCVVYEGQVNAWKEKFEVLDGKLKESVSEIVALKERLDKQQPVILSTLVPDEALVGALRAENERLKEQIHNQNDTSTAKGQEAARSATPTMRVAPIWDQGIEADIEFARQSTHKRTTTKSGSVGSLSSVRQPVATKTVSRKPTRRQSSLGSTGGLVGNIDALKRPDFIPIVCKGLVKDLAIPELQTGVRLEKRDVHFPAQIL